MTARSTKRFSYLDRQDSLATAVVLFANFRVSPTKRFSIAPGAEGMASIKDVMSHRLKQMYPGYGCSLLDGSCRGVVVSWNDSERVCWLIR
jgi:hypothetical protein